jgi:protein-L-isoaspartate(D-aspartate) O-methyltransferase
MKSSTEIEPDFPWAHSWPEITDARVRRAFARVHRAEFIDPALRQYAATDAPLSIGEGQTISQPFVVALMVQAAALQPGDRVLEVGFGSGYQTAILCELTAAPDQPLGATVYAVERLATLAQRSTAVLHRLGYFPHLRIGDGAAGWPEAAPFSTIVVSAAVPQLPAALVAQLDEGGRLLAPVGDHEAQQLWLVRKIAGEIMTEDLGGVRFVPLISTLVKR